jgi:hypothetical protein
MTTLSGEEPLNLGIHPLLECDLEVLDRCPQPHQVVNAVLRHNRLPETLMRGEASARVSPTAPEGRSRPARGF